MSCSWIRSPRVAERLRSGQRRAGVVGLVVACTDAFQRRESRAMVVGQTVGQARALWRTNKQPLRKQPAYLNRAGMLRDYQLEGVNW